MTPAGAMGDHEHDRPDSESSEGTVYEAQRQELNTSNPKGNSNVGNDGVDIEAAEREFHEINRQLTEISRHATRESRRSIHSIHASVQDPEKADEDGAAEEPFDLETHLHGSQADEESVGIKPKHIGMLYNPRLCNRRALIRG